MNAERATPLRVDATVVALVDEGGENRRLRLAVPGWPGFAPGQFVMLSPGVRGSAPRRDPLLPRPMAVYRTRSSSSRPPHDAGDGAEVEILFKVHGRGTALLADARPGEALGLVGPLGTPFPAPAGRAAVLVAGGTGIASVYELARRLHSDGVATSVLLGARGTGDLMGEADFAELGVDLEVATEDGSRGRRGLVTALLEGALGSGAADATVYACGPTRMMEAAAGIAAAAGRACFVSLENPMACGFGVCLGCAAPLAEGGFALVCRDGPVFAAERVAWKGLP